MCIIFICVDIHARSVISQNIKHAFWKYLLDVMGAC